MIDLHAHVVLEGTLGRAGAAGPELIEEPPSFRVGSYRLDGVRYRGSAFMDVEVRLERMRQLGVTHQVLSPNPLTYFQRLAVADATRYARWHNDELATLVAAHPQLSGVAQLPMQSPAEAAEELRRAVDAGLLGAAIGNDYGPTVDDPRYDAVWSTAAELDVPICIHPTTPGVDAPVEQDWRFGLELTLGFAMEETRTVVALVAGGVLDRHPTLRVWISHGGGALAALAPKLAMGVERRPGAAAELRETGAFTARLGRLFFDAHGAPGGLADLVGTERICGGTNFAGWDQPTELPGAAVTAQRDAASRALFGSHSTVFN